MLNNFLDLHQIVQLVKSPNRNSIIEAYVENAEKIAEAPGSRKKHQAWKGGYLDHVVYATNFGLRLHHLNKDIGFKPDYEEGDVALVMLLHDFGKIAKYKKLGERWDYVENPSKAEHNFLNEAINKYGFLLTDIHKNALEFVHGEDAKYTPEQRLMLPLAVVCHQADIWNARYSPDNPLPNGLDPWKQAYRHSEKPDLVEYIKELDRFKI